MRTWASSALAGSEARCALIAVIDAEQARRSPEERCERRGRPCRHNARAGGNGRAGFMSGARGRGPTAMSARAANRGSNGVQTMEGDRLWVKSPLGRDLAGLLAWDLVVFPIGYVALVGSVLGDSALWTYLFVIPVTIILTVPLNIFTILPMMSARRIGLGSTGLAVVRFRTIEEYPWSGVKPGYRVPRTFPITGGRYPISLTAGPDSGQSPVYLDRAQAEAIASHFGESVEQIWLPRS